MHFKKRNSLRITSKFLITKERVVFMPEPEKNKITENILRSFSNKLIAYGNDLYDSLTKARADCQQKIAEKLDTFKTEFDKLKTQTDKINTEIAKIGNGRSVDDVRGDIQNNLSDVKEIFNSALNDLENNILEHIERYWTVSKAKNYPLAKQLFRDCTNMKKSITKKINVNPEICVYNTTCCFDDLENIMMCMVVGENWPDVQKDLNKNLVNNIIQSFEKEGVVVTKNQPLGS